MKIRFYHWWIYKLYYKFWTPILEQRPDMVKEIIDHMLKWQDHQKKYDDGKDVHANYRG